jgi:hypothetical protein
MPAKFINVNNSGRANFRNVNNSGRAIFGEVSIGPLTTTTTTTSTTTSTTTVTPTCSVYTITTETLGTNWLGNICETNESTSGTVNPNSLVNTPCVRDASFSYGPGPGINVTDTPC